jgi:hypothetical protein
MREAVWRGNRVKVLAVSGTRVVILTPLEIRLAVSIHEVRTATGEAKPKKDSRKF